jgi:Domain of unknown function (DUF5668)
MTDSPGGPNDADPTTGFEPAPSTAATTATPPPAAPPAPPISPAVPPPPPPPAPGPPWGSRRDDPGRTGTIVVGAILVAIGLWFFADQTLGLDMPSLRWSQLWPIFLIGLGVWIAIGSLRRR